MPISRWQRWLAQAEGRAVQAHREAAMAEWGIGELVDEAHGRQYTFNANRTLVPLGQSHRPAAR